MATMRVAPARLTAVMSEAERIATLLNNKRVKLSEAKKALQFYVYSGSNRTLFEQYLSKMASDPPPRSQQTRGSYQALMSIWRDSGRNLSDQEKGYAWHWAFRLAQAAQRR